ncbi:MAG: phosphoenolpyruvate synthase [Pseudonocardiaceae bacterium]|nr:phosphoenolpyruvate synthase [Pseudonocardiaceae bacterium]
MNEQPTVVRLSEAGSVNLVGGKGANLGRLLRGRFPVPDGFAVTTAAYDQIVPARVPELLARAPGGSAVRELIESVEVPAELSVAIRRAYRDLGGGAVAVRSSATAEDLPQAAFAGQQDSYLNVIGAEAVLDAVRRCWASLWTERAIAYRGRQGVTDAKIAVVVQRMVDAEFAGVLFTANPVTGARDEVVIDAGAGLGEAVVAGVITPDHYVLRKHRPKQARRGRQDVAVRPLPGGGTEEVAGTSDREVPSVALKKLSKLGKAIERHFSAPQDIEWAWANGQAFVVQARPITALSEPPRKGQEYQMVTLAELLPIRPYPLDSTTWTGAVFDAVRQVQEPYGKLPPLDEWRREEDGVVVWWDRPMPKPTPRSVLAIGTMFRLIVRYNPRDMWADPLRTEVIERTRTLEEQDLSRLDWTELHAGLREALGVPLAVWQLRLYLMRTFLGVGYVFVVLALLGKKDRLNELYACTGSITIEINRAIEELAARVRADDELREFFASHEPAELLNAIHSHPFAAEFQGFLDRYGNRETVSVVLASQPTWRAAPEVVLSMIKGFAAPPPPRTGPAAVLREQLLDHRFLRPITARALEMMALYGRIMEDTHFYMTLPLPYVRRVMLEFGRRLTEHDLLDHPEDVLHLRLDEALPLPGRREIVARRKAKRAALEGTPYVPPDRPPQTEIPDNALLAGMPGSPGIVQGPARIIHGPHEFGRLQTGDVLVAHATHPAWTPLFQRAAAVIVDTGGPAAHAAIVAREYGIPAVMGTGDGTTRLTDGQAVRVDGNRGAVLPAE